MRTALDYVLCFFIKHLPNCRLERWMIRVLIEKVRTS